MTVDGKRSRSEAAPSSTGWSIWVAALCRRRWRCILLQRPHALGGELSAERWSCRSRTGSARIMDWLKSNFTWLTRSITAVLDVPLDFAFDLLAKGFKFGHGAEAVDAAALSWVGVCAAALPSPATPSAAGGSALLVGGCFLYHRAVRPVGQRHADAGADRRSPCRSASSLGLLLGIWAIAQPRAEQLRHRRRCST